VADESQEKTEEPTPKKMRDARKKGQIAKSRDLNTVALLVATILVLGFFIRQMGGELTDLMEDAFRIIAGGDLTEQLLRQTTVRSGLAFLKVVVPLFTAVFVVVVAVAFLQVGGLFTLDPLKPQIEKLNPVEGFKNLFKLKNFVELLKSTVKLLVVAVAAYVVINRHKASIILAFTLDVPRMLLLVGRLVTELVLTVIAVFVLIALIDVIYQRWQHKKDLRMSKQEIKQEYKNDEGSPEIKGRRRSLHQELAMGDVQQAVAKSDAVVVNPIHLAVAVQYNVAEMDAPEIMAKGQRVMAQKIRDWAQDAGVPIIQNVPLAHALYELDIGDQVPDHLYEAVAEVLHYVYSLKNPEEVSPEPA